MRVTISDIIRMLSDLAEIVVTVLLAYGVYRIAKLIETLDDKIKGHATA